MCGLSLSNGHKRSWCSSRYNAASVLFMCGMDVSPCLLSVWMLVVRSCSFVGSVRSVFCQIISCSVKKSQCGDSSAVKDAMFVSVLCKGCNLIVCLLFFLLSAVNFLFFVSVILSCVSSSMSCLGFFALGGSVDGPPELERLREPVPSICEMYYVNAGGLVGVWAVAL